MRPALAAAAVLALLAAAPASAQTRSDDPGADGPSRYDDRAPPADARYGQPPSGSREDYGDRDGPPTAGQAQDPGQDLVRQLNLRPDQRSAFRDYQAAFQAQTRGEDQERDEAQRVAGMTTPQRLDYAAQQMQRDRADFDRVADATRRLYASLDSLQRRTFDRLTAPQLDQDDGDEGDGPQQQPPPSSR